MPLTTRRPLSRLHGVLFVLGLFCLGQASAAGDAADSLFMQAQAKYELQDYKAALESIKTAVKLAPGISAYHHLLGKCYGKLAESAIWFRATSLARKTLESLRRAVELDNENVSALRDLRDFYRRAPRFIGGDKDKADAIDEYLTRLENRD